MPRRPPAGLTLVRISSWGAEPVRSRVGLPLGTDVLRQTTPADQNRFNSVDDTSNFISVALKPDYLIASLADKKCGSLNRSCPTDASTKRTKEEEPEGSGRHRIVGLAQQSVLSPT